MSELKLKGFALKSAVRAAEAPITGELVARNFIASLELDTLRAIDLRDLDSPPPASLPHHPRVEEVEDE